MSTRLRMLALAGLGLLGCRQQQTILVPNRVLDRPLDVVLACVQRNGDEVTQLSLNACTSVDDCDQDGANQLIGFVANSDTNEVGMFRRCDVNGMVDLDPEAPGYNLVPVGSLPSKIVDTFDCRVVTANAGSCDLTAIELLGLSSYAVGLVPDGAPSSLVSTIVPLRGNGEPLGARPGDMIALPPRLSLVGGVSEDPDGVSAAGVCDPDAFASVLVTFPSCHLVAEINLATHRILQSRQFVTDADGVTQVIDPGPDPVCPVECPGQFDGDPPEPVDVVDGVFPVALALVDAGRSDESSGQEASGPYSSVYVGGTGSDEIFEIEFVTPNGTAGTTGFAPPGDTRRLTLEDPQGVSAIRVTPELAFTSEPGNVHQFLYVIAGDGSTHVVDRAYDRASLGVECDTQVDPSEASTQVCHPIDSGSAAQASRRPFAVGPGIRANDAVITDWAFERQSKAGTSNTAPFQSDGVVGIGTTSGGRIVLALFDQYQQAGRQPTTAGDAGTHDPLGLMNVALGPHMLWPVSDPHGGDPLVLPLVADEEPDRLLPGEDQATQVLAPTVRRIDLGYAAADNDATYSDEQVQVWHSLGNPDNVDGLGDFDGNSLYERPVARVAVRDYRQWRSSQTWNLIWEMEVPGTRSQTGRLDCETPSEFGEGSCAEGARIIDEGATFCDEGVLPGDKLLIGGCGVDDDCGLGQRCLRDPSSGGGTTGICVSSQAYEEDLEALREYCKPFISDPCGSVTREYLVTDVAQTGVTLAPLDLPAVTFLRDRCPEPAGAGNLRDPLGGKPVPPPEPPPPEDGEAPPLTECEARLTCAVPEGVTPRLGGCTDDADCEGLGGNTGAEYICFDGQCRTPCEGGSLNCRQRVLPGPGCFGEFITYTIALRDTFAVAIDPSPSFITDRVRTEPDGTCSEDTTQSNLLTSRLWLGADEDDTFSKILDCPNAAEVAPSDPNPCRIVTRREDDPQSLYHAFSYNTDRVEALRFSNPYGTLVVDLVSLRDLGAETDLLGDTSQAWPQEFARFRRARIPRAYRESFSTPPVAGYQTFNDPIVVSSTPLTYPVRIVPAPETGVAFVVDAGGRGGASGVRGQVVRILVTDAEIRGDEQFLVR